ARFQPFPFHPPRPGDDRRAVPGQAFAAWPARLRPPSAGGGGARIPLKGWARRYARAFLPPELTVWADPLPDPLRVFPWKVLAVSFAVVRKTPATRNSPVRDPVA